MTIPEKTSALWSADAAAIALVPAAQFKPSGIYQGITLPYVIFFPVYTERYRTINAGAIGALQSGLWQFSIFAVSLSSAQTIADKLITVLDGNKGGFNFFFRASRFVNEDVVSKSVHVAVDFMITAN